MIFFFAVDFVLPVNLDCLIVLGVDETETSAFFSDMRVSRPFPSVLLQLDDGYH